MTCENNEANLKSCTCTYDLCDRKGYCCKCIAYHRNHGELPGCLFPPEGEKTYNRSIEEFLRWQRK